MAKWDSPGVPHKGWTLVGYEDIKEERFHIGRYWIT